MNQRIQRIEAFLVEKGSKWVFPLSFTFSTLVNVVFFYIGFGFDENPVRAWGFIVFNVLFALFCGLTLLAVLRTHRLSLRTWILLSSVIVFYAIGFGVAFFRYGFSAPCYSGFLESFIVFGLSAFFAGGCGAIMKREKSFFEVLDFLSWLVLPMALMYINGSLTRTIPQEWNWGFDLGVLNYMNLAYIFLPYVLSHTLGIVSGTALKNPFSGKEFKYPLLVRGTVLLILWAATMGTGTRGVLLSVCIASVLIVAYQVLIQSFRPTSFAPLLLSCLLAFNLFIYSPPGFGRNSAFNTFFEGLSEGKIVTSKGDSENLAENMDDLVASDIPDTNPDTPIEEPPVEEPPVEEPPVEEPPVEEPPVEEPPVEEPPVEEPPVEEPPVEEPPVEEPPVEEPPVEEPPVEEPPVEEPEGDFKITNRGSMYKIAWKEFLKNPLTGMGPFGYEVKYRQYPHSVIFEVLCETGLLGSVYFLGLVLFVVIYLFITGLKIVEVRNILLFIMAYAILANIDTSLWDCPALMFALGYGITYGDKGNARTEE